MWLKKLAMLAVIAGVGYAGFLIYQKVTAPKGQVTSSISNPSLMASFRAKLFQPDLALVVTDDQMALVRLSSGQKQWTVSLPTLEEKATPPKRVTAGGGGDTAGRLRVSRRVTARRSARRSYPGAFGTPDHRSQSAERLSRVGNSSIPRHPSTISLFTTAACGVHSITPNISSISPSRMARSPVPTRTRASRNRSAWEVILR